MKKVFLLAFASLFLFCITSNAQLKMDSNGDVGIGYMSTDPGCQLEVRGTSYFNCDANSGLYLTNYSTSAVIKPQWGNSAFIGLNTHRLWRIYTNYLHYVTLSSLSDIRIKENIRNIDNPLSSICKIRGIQFDMKRDFYADSPKEQIDEKVEAGKNQYGVVAQELMEILPDLVMFNDEAELYEVNYVGLIPILVEAIKEQQLQIEELKAAIAIDEALKGASANTTIPDLQTPEAGTSTLYQNAPNPFTEETTISYYLNNNVNTASLFINDMNGRQISSHELHQRGNSEFRITGGNLDAGMYLYSLVVDGNLIGTKQMLLTE